MIFSCERFGSGETVLNTLIVIFDKSTKSFILARDGVVCLFEVAAGQIEWIKNLDQAERHLKLLLHTF